MVNLIDILIIIIKQNAHSRLAVSASCFLIVLSEYIHLLNKIIITHVGSFVNKKRKNIKTTCFYSVFFH